MKDTARLVADAIVMGLTLLVLGCIALGAIVFLFAPRPGFVA
jgi:hypothetical protein